MSGADTIDNGDPGAWAGGWKVRTASGIIVLAALAVYWNSFDGVFVLDDHQAIRNNRHIRTLWPLSEAISLPMWDTGPVVDGRPVPVGPGRSRGSGDARRLHSRPTSQSSRSRRGTSYGIVPDMR